MTTELANLGLTPFFQNQLTQDELDTCVLCRITEVQRSGVMANDGSTEYSVSLGGSWFRGPSELRPTVGDWVVLDDRCESIVRVLERKSVFKRLAAGDKVDVQLIAANIDTLFIVTSCNEEFEESRLERYLSLAIEAGVDPVVVLTKTDLTTHIEAFVERVRSVNSTVPVETVNSLDLDTLSGLKAWITNQTTIALVGSSGVGKSTILNSLAGRALMKTAPIREKDSRGRHTTTYRALHRISGGGVLLDVPGMRELKIANVDTALSDLFEDVELLADRCKFRDCEHDKERDCAVLRAVTSGELDKRRLQNYSKLRAEEAHLSASLAQRRFKDRKFGRMIKSVLQDKCKTRSKS